MVIEFRVKDAYGLHARVASKIVSEIEKCQAKVFFQVKGSEAKASGDSLLSLMQLEVKAGEVITMTILSSPKDIDAFVHALKNIIE